MIGRAFTGTGGRAIELESQASDSTKERLLQLARARRIRLLAETLGGLREPELDTLLRAAELMERAVGQAAARK